MFILTCTRIVLIGEGAPLLAVANHLTAVANAEISGIVSSTLLPEKLKHVPRDCFTSILSFLHNPHPTGDWLISINSKTLLPADVLDRFSDRALNLHNGPLPNYAGRHVTQWGIRNGETEFASTVHFMNKAVDTGDIVATRRYSIRPQDTGLSLFRKSFHEGRLLMIEVLDRILAGKPLQRSAQIAAKRHNYRHHDALDPRVPWTESARRVVDFLRAGDYRPLSSPSYTASLKMPGDEIVLLYRASELTDAKGEPGEVLDILQEGPVVACGSGGVIITASTFGEADLNQATWRDLLTRANLTTLPGR